jgi:hypothetical protein
MKTWFLYRFSKDIQIPYFMEILPIEAELSHADERTDTIKSSVTLRILPKSPKNCQTLFSLRPKCLY